MSLASELVALAFETTYGTPVSVNKYARVRACDFIIEHQKTPIPSITRRDGSEKFRKGRKSVGGSITSYVYPTDVGYWLKLFMGEVSSAVVGGESFVYDHTFTTHNGIISATIERDDGHEVRQAQGTVVNAFSLSSSQEIINLVLDLIIQDVATSSTYNPIFEVSEVPFVFHDANLYIGDDVNTALASTPISVDTWELNLTNNCVTLPPFVDSDVISGARFGPLLVNGQFTKVNTDSDYEGYVEDDTEKALVLKMIGDSIGSSSNFELQINLPKVLFTVSTKPFEAGSIMLEDVSFSALYNAIDEHKVEIRLRNIESNYN